MNVIPLFPTNVFTKQCNLDLEELRKKIYKFQLSNETSTHSNVGGYQGHGFDCPELNEVIASSLPYDKNNPMKELIITSWVNINQKNDYNEMHSHDPYTGTALSGTFYVSTPENCGDLRLHDPRFDILTAPDMKYYNNGNLWQMIQPKENMLVIFPAWLQHSVLPNKSDEDRISISFNIAFVF